MPVDRGLVRRCRRAAIARRSSTGWPPRPAATSRACTTSRYDGPGRVAAITPGPAPSARRGPEGRGQGRRSARSARHRDLHARHGVRIAAADRGRAGLRQPVPVLLGRLQLPARSAVFDRPDPRDRRGGAAACEPRRPRVDRAVRSPRHRDASCRALVAMGYGISPASLRLDDLTEPIVRLLRESGERSITIAPETGSDRLRRVINKTVTNERDSRPGRPDLPVRHREPEALLHGRPSQRDRRGPESRFAISRLADSRAHDRPRSAARRALAGSSRPSTRSCRSPARRISGCR